MSSFSYSKIDTYKQCGFKYKLVYEDGIYKFSESIATEFGSLVHKVEENIANCIKDGKTVNYEEHRNFFLVEGKKIQEKYNKAFNDELDKSYRTYREKANYYINNGILRLENFLRNNPSYEVIGTEMPFEFEFEGNKFKGFIDRVFRDRLTNTYIIQDIKTYAVPIAKDQLATPLQFVVYSLAVAKMFNCNINSIRCEYDLPLCDIVQPAGTKGFIERGKQKLEKLLLGVDSKDFKPNPTPLCHWCNFCPTNEDAPEDTKYLCPYFCKWTKENKDFSKEFEWQGIENHKKILESYNFKLKK